ncbi:TIGR02186 family protein [Fulvimarina sp. MAC8]|uniref:TIGR02186 family protein n=1 Tax=Fulvimarina sp. MAC8 TaxID=3162874 RepID=UPI0032F001F7
MRRRLTIARTALAALTLLMIGTVPGGQANAQQAVEEPPESFDIGLSSSTIGITSDFNGEDLTIFGALDNADARVRRQQRYDIVIALFGPREPIVVREKSRFFGIWINRESATISAAPATYSLASTRPLRDITSQRTRERLNLGIATLRLDGTMPKLGEERPQYRPKQRFEEALRRIKTERSLYSESIGGVQFLGPSLFRADLRLPPDLPVGQHTARAYLFREGKVIKQTSRTLNVVKVGFQAQIDVFASNHGLIFGFFAVFVAIITGWLGRLMFKRD